MYDVRLTKEQAYELLMRKLPGWFKPVLEYDAIERAHSVPVATFSADADTIQHNFFVQTADEETIRRIERMLGISAQPSDTLEYRRQRILTATQQTSPFTEWHLRERLTELFGDEYTLTVDSENCSISIYTSSARYGAVELLDSLIAAVVPAHLYVESNQEVVRYANSNQYIAASVDHTVVHDIRTTGGI